MEGQEDKRDATGHVPSDYPPGFEPELEGEELKFAVRQEGRYRWMVRFELLFLVAIVALIVYFIVTS